MHPRHFICLSAPENPGHCLHHPQLLLFPSHLIMPSLDPSILSEPWSPFITIINTHICFSRARVPRCYLNVLASSISRKRQGLHEPTTFLFHVTAYRTALHSYCGNTHFIPTLTWAGGWHGDVCCPEGRGWPGCRSGLWTFPHTQLFHVLSEPEAVQRMLLLNALKFSGA